MNHSRRWWNQTIPHQRRDASQLLTKLFTAHRSSLDPVNHWFIPWKTDLQTRLSCKVFVIESLIYLKGSKLVIFFPQQLKKPHVYCPRCRTEGYSIKKDRVTPGWSRGHEGFCSARQPSVADLSSGRESTGPLRLRPPNTSTDSSQEVRLNFPLTCYKADIYVHILFYK